MALYALKTTGAPVKLIARADSEVLQAANKGLAQIFVSLCDENGNPVYSAENEITCEVKGPAKLLGMEDSNPVNTEYYKDNKQHAYHGKILVYVKSAGIPGKAEITLSSPGLKGAIVKLNIVK
jgi:hypothetical protein